MCGEHESCCGIHCACGEITDAPLVEVEVEVSCTESPDGEAENSVAPDLSIGVTVCCALWPMAHLKIYHASMWWIASEVTEMAKIESVD